MTQHYRHDYRHARQVLLWTALACSIQAMAQTSPTAPRRNPATNAAQEPARPAPSFAPCASVEVGPAIAVAMGKSSVDRLPVPMVRMLLGGQPSSRASVPPGGPAQAGQPMPGADVVVAPGALGRPTPLNDGVAEVEITLLSPTELFLLGRKPGAMNLVLQSADGRCFVRDVVVTVDSGALQSQIAELLPDETQVRVRGAENALVLTGQVSDALRLDDVLKLAGSYGNGRRVVNLLRVASPQQVMLEVKIAEVSKSLLDRFGIDYARVFSSGLSAAAYSGIFGGRPGVIGRLTGAATLSASGSASLSNAVGGAAASVSTTGAAGSATLLGIDAQQRDGLSRVLAEPNIMAISGQQASFLSGGKIFIPVAQSRDGGGTVITLEEKQFGVGLRFTPTVLDGSRVNLKLMSEVSELAQTGSAFTTIGGVTSVLPSLTSRSVDTTVQLQDGQSFVIAGLIKNNMAQSVNRFPGLGDVPILGALFRSTEFQKDQTELVFVVTPRLVKALTTAALLPTDVHVEPNRAEAVFMGAGEGRRVQAAPPLQPSAPAAPALSPTQALPDRPTPGATDTPDMPGVLNTSLTVKQQP